MRNLVFFLVSLLSLPAFGCLNMKGVMNLNGQELKINQKVDHDKTYSFTRGPYIVNVLLTSGNKDGTHQVDIKVDLKEESSLKRVSNGKLIINEGEEAMMTSQNDKTNERFSYRFKVKSI